MDFASLRIKQQQTRPCRDPGHGAVWISPDFDFNPVTNQPVAEYGFARQKRDFCAIGVGVLAVIAKQSGFLDKAIDQKDQSDKDQEAHDDNCAFDEFKASGTG